MAEHSEPEEDRFVFAYTITLVNRGSVSAQLLSRHWVIVDALGRREEVRGDGVVGVQPTLAPGESHEYTSGCPLRTEWGTMEGSYLFRTEAGEEFEVAVGRFFLAPNVAPIPGGLSV